MKNVIKLVFVLGLCFSQNAISQVVIPHPIPCLEVTPDNVGDLESGVQANDCIEADGATVTFSSDQNYSIKAGEYIQFDDNTVIEPDTAHSFHAFIQREDLDLAWYYPNATPGTVGRYEKLEIGAQFGDSINDKILNFVENSAGDSINPFNPDEIDLYAEFWYLIDSTWYGPKRINGFFYQEYERGSTHWDTVLTTHNFRVRYAPPITGTYRCKVTAEVEGHGTQTTSEFTFECVTSSNKGFVDVGENKRYFVRGNEPFYPVGQNITGPRRPSGVNTPAKPDAYLEFYETMGELKDNGANYFRYIASPWQTEIEFEHLGNYSNRMTNAWEFDNILDSAKSLDLMMHFNMAMHYNFEKPSGYGFVYWDWSAAGDSLNTPISPDGVGGCFRDFDVGYCYRNDLGLTDPEDFFTNADAIKHYKNRIRYMVSRWGYSTNIAVMELLSEASHVATLVELEYLEGDGCYPVENTLYRPYDKDSLFPEKIFDWHLIMADFMKDSLGMSEHLISVNYAGEPDYYNNDLSYYLVDVDIMTYNEYSLHINQTFKTYKTVSEKYHKYGTDFYGNKPFMNSEYGTGAKTYLCDNNTGFLHRICETPFTGLAGVALTWDYHYNEADTWQHFKHVNDMMAGIPLDAENWRAGEAMVQDDKSVEVMYLRKEETGEESKIAGVIANKTFNYWTQSTGGECADGDNEPNLEYRIANDFIYSDLEEENMEFQDMGSHKNFKIDWFNAVTGASLGTTPQSSNLWGKLSLRFPDTLTGDGTCPIIFFKLYPSGDTFLTQVDAGGKKSGLPESFKKEGEIEPIALTDWSINNESQILSVLVSPNPVKSTINVSVSYLNEGMRWSLTDLKGNILDQGIVLSTNFNLDLSVYSSGGYYFIIESETNRVSTQIIKQ